MSFTVDIPSSGTYDIIINSMGYGGDKTNNIKVDGTFVGTFVTKAEEYNDAVLSRVILTEHRIIMWFVEMQTVMAK